MPEIKERKNIYFSVQLDATGSFTQRIIVNFIPDIMNVKMCGYGNDGTEEGVSSVYSTLTNEDISTFFDKSIITDCYTAKINKPIDSNYDFIIRSINGITDNTRAGFLNLSLEFIKYE